MAERSNPETDISRQPLNDWLPVSFRQVHRTLCIWLCIGSIPGTEQTHRKDRGGIPKAERKKGAAGWQRPLEDETNLRRKSYERRSFRI
jgi:hypothetical protein